MKHCCANCAKSWWPNGRNDDPWCEHGGDENGDIPHNRYSCCEEYEEEEDDDYDPYWCCQNGWEH